MKFPSLALLSCSFLIQSSTARQSSNDSELRSCFLKCGRKDVDKANKVEDCQLECAHDQFSAGRSADSVGPYGAENLLQCGAQCAKRAEDRFKRKRRNFDGKDEKDCKKKCDSDSDECKKKIDECKKKAKEAERRNERNAEDRAEEKYEDCTEKCFESTSVFSNFATALKNFKPQVLVSEDDDDLEKCFERCGRGKDVEDADDIEECQLDCIEEQVENGRSRNALGPNGVEALMLCGADCAEEAEDEFDRELRNFKRDIKDLGDKKDCEKKKCAEGDEDCIKKCEKAIKEVLKDLKKEAEDEAEEEAEKKYRRCNRRCFEPDSSFFKLGYVA